MLFRLMLVTDNELLGESNLTDIIVSAVKGGVDAVQIREKNMDYKDLFDLTYEIKNKLGNQALIFINGNPEIARELDVGLHLPSQFKLNNKFNHLIWGRSVHSVSDVVKAQEEGASYVILGTIFKTTSKPKIKYAGTNLIKEVVSKLGAMQLIAIGGINLLNVGKVINAGATGVAVRESILKSINPEKTSKEFLAIINKNE